MPKAKTTGSDKAAGGSDTAWLESVEAIAAVDAIFGGVGLEHGRRASRTGAWKDGERVKAKAARQPQEPTGEAGTPGVVRVPGWDRMPWLRAGFSTRAGGESSVYSEGCSQSRADFDLNLGFTRDDDGATVARNRERFVHEVAGDGVTLATLRQTHTPLVRWLAAPLPALHDTGGRAVLRGDALVTDVPGVLLGVQTADCIPVLLVDPKRRVVAAFHAGWRGTLARVVERGVGFMRVLYGSSPQDLLAAVGPGIGACCYAVGEEVKFEFGSQFAYAAELFSEVYDSDPVRDKYPLLFMTARAPGHSDIGPQIHIDLPEANRRQLLDAGLKAGNITVIGECTACTVEPGGRRRYFSHRADHGFTGRMMSVVGIA